MRVFSISTSGDLLGSSGCYSANLEFLQLLSSKGHDVVQLCLASQDAINAHLSKLLSPNFELSFLSMPASKAGTSNIQINTFSHRDGLKVIALDAGDFAKTFPQERLKAEVTNYIERGRPSAQLQTYLKFVQTQVSLFSPTHILCHDLLSLKAISRIQGSRKACRVYIHPAKDLGCGPLVNGSSICSHSPAEHRLLQRIDGVSDLSSVPEHDHRMLELENVKSKRTRSKSPQKNVEEITTISKPQRPAPFRNNSMLDTLRQYLQPAVPQFRNHFRKSSCSSKPLAFAQGRTVVT